MGYKRYTRYCDLVKKIVDTKKLYDCFIENYNLLVDRLRWELGDGSLESKNLLEFYRIRLELLKSQFCISNVLLDLLFCERSPSAPDNCKQCSRSYVYDDYDVYTRRFVSYVSHHFTSILPSNNVFDKDLELLFASPEAQVRRIDLNLLYLSKDYYDLVVSKQNRCMYFLVAWHPCELAIVLSEVLVRILLNEIISIAGNILKCHVFGCVFGISSSKEKRVCF